MVAQSCYYMGMKTRLTPEQIKEVLASGEAKSHTQILKSLGMSLGVTNYNTLARVASENGITLPPKHHAGRKGDRPLMRTGRAWDEEALRLAASESTTMVELCTKMGYRSNGSGYNAVRKALREFGIEFDTPRGARPDAARGERILVKSNRRESGSALKSVLYRDGLKKEECESCGLGPHWNGKPLVLQIDHLNGDKTDHRVENLAIVCPNCHTQTSTFAGRNISK